MNPERWKQIDQLLDTALELDSDERKAFLEEACAGDQELRKELETLIASDRRAHSFIEAPVVHEAAQVMQESRGTLSQGDSLGPYKILSLLGSGGMGEVYRAKHILLEREVAIKVLPVHLSQNPQALSRFKREAKALAVLSHINILTIHDFGTENEISYAVMELLTGQTLRAQLESSKMTAEEALRVALQLADGLAAAHSAGVTHRDLKPENIFITFDGTIKILDFGLALLKSTLSLEEGTSAETISQTERGLVVGTVPYMSPEQVRGDSIDVRTDIFSFGCVFYEMLSGTRPFARKTPIETMAAILNEQPPQLSQVDGSIRPQVNLIIQRCLQKNPDDRFQTAKDLTLALKDVNAGSTVLPLTTPVRVHRTSVPLRGIAALVLLLVIGGSFYHFQQRGQAIHSLAILPFANGSADPNAEYLSDGISDSIINNLSNLHELKVMSHDTVFTYKSKQVDPRKVGADLDVEAIVTGRLMQRGNILVIRASLIDVSDGTVLWGEQYDRKLEDILKIQQEISSEISRNLKLKLTGTEHQRVRRKYTENSEAYQLYIKGEYHWYKFTPEDYEKSIEYYTKAIQKDPKYAQAYAGLGQVYNAMTFEGLLPPAEGFERARTAALTALKIDDSIGPAHVALAETFWGEWNWKEAEREFKRCLELSPNYVPARRYYSQFVLNMGRSEEAIVEMKRALEIDPLSRETNKSMGARFFWVRQYDQAIEQLRKTLDLDPNFAAAHDLLSDVYERKGLYQEAIQEQKKYLSLAGDDEGAQALIQDYEKHGYLGARKLQYEKALKLYKEIALERYVSPVYFVYLYARLNQKDQAFEYLEKAYQERSPWMHYFSADPQVDNLRSDPRFKDLMRRLGLPS